jgi:MFS family permease
VAGSWHASTLAPFQSRVFLAVWSATIVSNFGSLIQAVGASWLMTSLAPSPDMVALVQASTTLPIMLLSLPSGAIADIFDRRLIMLIAQIAMLVLSTVLALIAWSGHITPWTLLTLTFLIGCGVALHGPAWQSSVGEQVPRDHIPAAVALNTMSYNLARTAGPAVGGVIVATSGPHAAFFVNAFTYVALIVVLISWRRPKPVMHLPPESMGTAIFAGLRYVRLSPPIRTVLLRGFALGLFGSSIWALMPLIARDLLGGGALTYGILFGSFGVGAVVGALISTTARERLTNEALVRISGLVFGIAVAVSGASPWMALTLGVFVLGGASWVLMLSTFNITVQMSAPRWVVGRALATYQMVTFGGLAIGSWMWGEIAADRSLTFALVASGIALALAVLIGVTAPLPQHEKLNLAPLRPAPQHLPRMELGEESGPVVVTIEYRIRPEDYADFAAAMREVRRIRRRDGGRRWSLMQDMEDPERWIERFHSPSWIDHLRHYHRFTVADEEIERRALAFHRAPEPPRIRHLLERSPGSVPLPVAGDPNVAAGPL